MPGMTRLRCTEGANLAAPALALVAADVAAGLGAAPALTLPTGAASRFMSLDNAPVLPVRVHRTSTQHTDRLRIALRPLIKKSSTHLHTSASIIQNNSFATQTKQQHANDTTATNAVNTSTYPVVYRAGRQQWQAWQPAPQQ
jgi:hypothetical protein